MKEMKEIFDVLKNFKNVKVQFEEEVPQVFCGTFLSGSLVSKDTHVYAWDSEGNRVRPTIEWDVTYNYSALRDCGGEYVEPGDDIPGTKAVQLDCYSDINRAYITVTVYGDIGLYNAILAFNSCPEGIKRKKTCPKKKPKRQSTTA